MDRTVPTGAATAAARDRYDVYRPTLDLIGKSEGTDKGRGYNKTLGYTMMLDSRVTKSKGPIIDLVSMTGDQVDAVQSRMRKDPDNKRLNSSALSRYQEMRTTRRLFDETPGSSVRAEQSLLLGVRSCRSRMSNGPLEDVIADMPEPMKARRV